MRDHRALAYALLRITVGVMFLSYGIGKFVMGPARFAVGLRERLAESVLPPSLVGLFGLVLPFAEVTIGALLVLGLFTRFALVLAALLMIALTFGAVMEPSPPTVAANVNYALIIALLLWLVEHNGYALDRTGGGAGG